MSFGYGVLGHGAHVRASAGLLTDMVSWWEHEESSGTHYDAHGTNDLANANNVSSGTGKQGNSAVFNSNKFLHRSGSHGLHAGDRDFTYATWFRIDSFATDMVLANVGTGGTPATNDWMIYFSSVSKVPMLFIGSGSSWYSKGASSFGAISSGTWYCVIAEYNSVTNTIGISMNDGVVDTVGSVPAPNNTGGTFYMGRWNPGNYLTGEKDLSVFASRVWTADEKSEYYNGGSGIVYPGS